MITSNPDTKQIVKDYWANGFPKSFRIDNLEQVRDLFNKAMTAGWQDRTKFSYISSHTSQFKKLFKYSVRRAGEYSWSYQFVLNYIDLSKVNGNVQILIYTEKGKGTGYEYLSGRKDMIIPFLKHLKQMIEKESGDINDPPN